MGFCREVDYKGLWDGRLFILKVWATNVMRATPRAEVERRAVACKEILSAVYANPYQHRFYDTLNLILGGRQRERYPKSSIHTRLDAASC